MSKEELNAQEEHKQEEQTLDFEDAKEMTVGEASRRSEEIEAGVSESDSVLDKYIKQHRAEIEAGKYDTQVLQAEALKEATSEPRRVIVPVDLSGESDSENGEVHVYEPGKSRVNTDSEPERASEGADLSETIVAGAALAAGATVAAGVASATQAAADSASSDVSGQVVAGAGVATGTAGPATSAAATSRAQAASALDFDKDEETPFYKKKAVLYSVAALLGLGLVGGTVYYYVSQRSTPSATSTSSSSKKSSSSSSSKTSVADDLKSFNDMYADFFTDAEQTAVKNEKFGDLDKLKAALEKLKGSSEYDAAKKKYDDLAKQVSAIQTVNSQFETAAITNGVLDPNAKAKSDAAFTDTTTGNEALDKVLKEASEQGRSQLVASPAPQTGGTVVTTEPAPATPVAPTTPTAPATPVTPTTPVVPSNPAPGSIVVSGYGVSPATFLQRHLSRVPYNQAAINDVNNPAWNFPAGVLENILNESRRRGYFTGNNYVLERVNIINGNGYYNLFKSDGTYLFSINARTGYYVGNAKGHADALDF